MIAYRAMLDVPRELAQYVGRLLHTERRQRGTRKRSRALTCFHQAVFALRWFRENHPITALAGDHGISRATGYRYLDEVITDDRGGRMFVCSDTDYCEERRESKPDKVEAAE